jgi:hypothetical protein
MHIVVLTSLIGLIFMTLSACAPLAVSGAVSASAVVSSTAAPLHLLENITDVRFLPSQPATNLSDCTKLLTQLSVDRSGAPTLKLPATLKQPAQTDTSESIGCKKFRFDEATYKVDTAFVGRRTIVLKEQYATEIVDFFNARQYRWQKGSLPEPYTTAVIQQASKGNELHFYRDQQIVQTIKFKYGSLESSLNEQPIHRALSAEEWKWLNERIPLSQAQSLRVNAGDQQTLLQHRAL